MYARQFGLTQDPFSIAPDPRFLFMSERHREALAHLLFGVAGPDGSADGGFVLLTGEIGTGKTTVCRCFLEQVPKGCHVAYIFNPKLSVIELLQSICEEFSVTLGHASAQPLSVKDHVDALNAFLLQSHAAGHNCVLVIDEAQNLAPDVLEQLRLLTNLETAERKLLQIVLIGQPELRSMLASPALEQLAQRVIARYHLDALNPDESLHYITHRLAVAGHVGSLPFDKAALGRIYQLTQGVPRRINLLCGRAMLGAWANGQQQISRRVVDKAAVEIFGAEQSPRAGIRGGTYAWGGVAAVGAIAAVAVYMGWPNPQQALPAPLASGPAVATSAAIENIEDLDTLVTQLPRDINLAWRELATVWKLPAAEGDPCDATHIAPLQCHRSVKLNVARLRQLARPGILVLQKGNAAPVNVVLIGLNEQTATLSLAGKPHVVRWMALNPLWLGGFATYWRAPEGFSADLHGDSTGPAVAQLTSQLARLDGLPAPNYAFASASTNASGRPQLDEALKARIRGFQSAHGLKPDGVPGALTFMQLESVTNSMNPADPRLAH